MQMDLPLLISYSYKLSAISNHNFKPISMYQIDKISNDYCFACPISLIQDEKQVLILT